MLKRVGITGKTKKKVTQSSPVFEYTLPFPKGGVALVITQDDPDQDVQPAPLPNPNHRSNRLDSYVSPRIVGIVAVAINQFMGSTFLKEMRQTLRVNETPLEPEEIANGVVHPVTKETKGGLYEGNVQRAREIILGV